MNDEEIRCPVPLISALLILSPYLAGLLLAQLYPYPALAWSGEETALLSDDESVEENDDYAT